MVVGITWYRPGQWSAVKEFCEDREQMDPTYQIWKHGAEKTLRKLRRDGVDAERVDFDLEDFKIWCAVNRKRPDGESRSEFTGLRVRDARTT